MKFSKVIIDKLNFLIRFISYSESYMRRNNPLDTIKNDLMNFSKGMVSFNKKLKIARYRVNHLRYRLNQMETLIDGNNPYNLKKGNTIDVLR